jgi:hypothetical protein
VDLDPNVKAVGRGVTSITIGALAMESADNRALRADVARTVPATHLMSVPFSVPPGLFSRRSRRWILLDTSRGGAVPCLHQMLLDYKIRDGARERA